MRDPDRIDIMLSSLKEAWLLNPDMRLGQLLINVVSVNETCHQLFYIEDNEILEKLNAWVETQQQKSD